MDKKDTFYLVEVHGNGYVKTTDIHSAALLLSHRRPLWRMCKQWEYDLRRRNDLGERLNRAIDLVFVDMGDEDTQPIEAVDYGD